MSNIRVAVFSACQSGTVPVEVLKMKLQLIKTGLYKLNWKKNSSKDTVNVRPPCLRILKERGGFGRRLPFHAFIPAMGVNATTFHHQIRIIVPQM